MRQVVLGGWWTFTTDFESDLLSLYPDVAGWVTIGPGLLADPVQLLAAMDIEFRRISDGELATSEEVSVQWSLVKSKRALGKLGGAKFLERVPPRLRATPESVERAAQRKLLQNEAGIRRFFPGWDAFPAPGQMLISSITWAIGAGAWVHWPNFCTAVNAGRWAAVAVPHGAPASCQMNEHGENDSFRRRNAANLELAKRAVVALAGGGVDELDVRSVLLAAYAATGQTVPARLRTANA
jgi:GH24 family phage-related lysozyme (muramidase)